MACQVLNCFGIYRRMNEVGNANVGEYRRKKEEAQTTDRLSAPFQQVVVLDWAAV